MLTFYIQVCLSRKDVTDFKSYGVSIKVRFRDGEDWCELARGRQSGGEMSVTTAVYMVSGSGVISNIMATSALFWYETVPST